MIEINGEQKSGSGTIVRDAVSLSALTSRALHVTNIRTKRDKPGLRSQHLKGVETCKQICQGRIENAKVGSKEIWFWPGEKLYGGNYYVDIGTAGSTALLTSMLLPISIYCREATAFKINGGLFQNFAPSAYYLKYVLFPVLQRMGIRVELNILQAGYYPKGQGLIEVKIKPIRKKLNPVVFLEQGEISKIDGIALSSLLEERNVSDRMAAACTRSLRAKGYHPTLLAVYDTSSEPAFNKVSIQPGASLTIWAETENKCRIGSNVTGTLRHSSEKIGKEVARNLINDLESGATVDRYLADQLIPFCALADGTSEYLIPRLTKHVESRLWLVEEILGAKTQVKGNHVIIKGVGYQK